MPESRVFLDKHHNLVSPDVAEKMVTTTTDAENRVIEERWDRFVPNAAGPEERYQLWLAQRRSMRPLLLTAALGLATLGAGALAMYLGWASGVLPWLALAGAILGTGSLAGLWRR